MVRAVAAAGQPSTSGRLHRRLPWRIAALLCAVVVLGNVPVLSGTIFSADGAKRFQVTRNLVHEGRVDIVTTDRAPVGPDGRQYTPWGIGHSLVMVPFYLAGVQAARLAPAWREAVVEGAASVTNLAVTALLVVALALLVVELGFTTRTGVLVGLTYAFATIGWQQAKDSFEHPQIGLYFTALCYALNRFGRTGHRGWLAAGAGALGLALTTRYAAAVGVVAILVAIASGPSPRTGRPSPAGPVAAVGLVAAVLAPFVAFDLWFNYVRFGSFLETGYHLLLVGPPYFGRGFAPEQWPAGLWGLTFDWRSGLFVFSPVLLVGMAGIPSLARRCRHVAPAIGTLAVAHVGLYAAMNPLIWRGGWAWGPRATADVLPLLLLGLAPVYEALAGNGRRWSGWKAVVVAVVAVSALVQVLSVVVNYNRGFVKQAEGIGGHTVAGTSLRDWQLYLQAENVADVVRNLRSGAGFQLRVPANADAATRLDRSLSLGTFQMWWVYALHLGGDVRAIALVMVLDVGLLAGALAALRRSLRRAETSAIGLGRPAWDRA